MYEEYAERVLDILETKDPDQVSNIDELLEKYKGREQQLYEQMCVKYNLDSLPPSDDFVSRGRSKRHIKVFCRLRPPNDVERANELESMFKESFNMGLRDYETFRAALDIALTSHAPVKVDLDRKGKSFTKPFYKFEIQDVIFWLRSLGLSKYERLFKVKKVNGHWLKHPPPFTKKPALKLTDMEVINFQRKNKSTKFKLDGVLKESSSQQEIFDMIGWDQVASALGGYNTTLLAYGQTGSGKTHTMLGPKAGSVGLDSSKNVGIVPRCIELLISRLNSSEQVQEYELNMAIMEIEAEKMKDLLTPGLKLQMRYVGKDSTVTNLSWWKLESQEETLRLIKLAVSRKAAAQAQNGVSSRSHLIISLKLTSTHQDGNVQMSSLTFGDLAGSERETRGKGKSKDKKSIFALQNVIRALKEERAFVPYHGGMLTKLLRDSLGGNSRTSIIIHGSPHEYNRSDTVSALQFGELARKVFNEPKRNVILSRKEMETQMSSMKEELNYLRRLKNQKNNLDVVRKGSSHKHLNNRRRSHRRSISGQICDSFILLMNPEERPKERTSIQWIDSLIKNNEIVEESEDEEDLAEKRKREQEDAREIEMLQEKLTAINVRFKELQIESMKKDNQILGLEKTLQERSTEVSTLNAETNSLIKYPEELANERAKSAKLQEQARRLEEEALRLKNRINRRRNKKKKKACKSFFVFFG